MGLMDNPKIREQEKLRGEKAEQKQLARRRKIIRDGYEPIIPFFCKAAMILMIVLPIADIILEIVTLVQNRDLLTVADFFRRISWSVLIIWVVFGAILALLSMIQLGFVRNRGYEERIYKFTDEIPSGELSQYRKETDEDKAKAMGDFDEQLTVWSKPAPRSAWDIYTKNIEIVLIGAAVLLVFYLLVMFITR